MSKKTERLLSRHRTNINVPEHIRCQSLDLVEASHSNTISPFLYCHIRISGHIDIGQLIHAVHLTSRIVPEILYTYDFSRNRFTNLGFSAKDTVFPAKAAFENAVRWDLTKSPQLRITVWEEETRTGLVIGMSHLVTDGMGFLQYLYLLSSGYNNGSLGNRLKNRRDAAPFLRHIRILPQTDQTRYGKRVKAKPLRSDLTGSDDFCICQTISADDFNMVSHKAKEKGRTLNDAFLTAYAIVLARLQQQETVVISCPADLRRFHPEFSALTVANLTGLFKRIIVRVEPGRSFDSTLLQVGLEMKLQKYRHRCFEGIGILNQVAGKLPRPLLNRIIQRFYRLSPVSYSNFGVIDDSRLTFDGCLMTECFLTGSYRKAPDFQVSISTFRGECSFNCAVTGRAEEIPD